MTSDAQPNSDAPSTGRAARLSNWVRKKDPSFFAYFLAKVIPAVLSFITVTYTIRFISHADYGEWGFLGVVSGMLVPVVSLSLPQAMMRMYFDKKDERVETHASLVTTTFLVNTAGMLVVFVIACLLYFAESQAALGLLYFGGITTGKIGFSFFNYLSRVRNDYGLYLFNRVVESLLYTAFVATFVSYVADADRSTEVLGHSRLHWLAYASIGTVGLINAVNALYYSRQGLLSIKAKLLSKVELREMLAFSTPLIGTFFIGWLLASSDVWVLRRVGSLTATADYLFAVKIAGGVALVTESSLLDWPRFYYGHMRDNHADRDEQIARRVRSFLYMHIGAILLVRFIAAFAYDVLGAEQFVAGLEYLRYLVLGNFFFLLGNLMAAGIGYAKRTHLTLVTFLVPGAMNLGLNFLLIPRWGAHAAALTTLAAYLLYAILSFFMGRPFYRFQGGSRLIAVIAVALGAALLPLGLGA